MVEYVILSILLARALGWFSRPFQGRRWRIAAAAWMLTAVYAVSDETHQAMVAARHGAILDVFFDCLGGLIGVVLIWVWIRRRSA